MISKKDFFPNLPIYGKGGNYSNCRIYAYSTNLKFLKDFFLPSIIHLNSINNFKFDFNTMLLTNNKNGKTIDFTDKELTNYANGAPWEENEKETANGKIYESELSFTADTDNYSRFLNTINSHNKSTILLIIYNNGGARLVGNYNGATKYEEKFQSGAQKKVQIREIKYTFESFHPSFWVDIIKKEDKDWLEWWTYKDDYFSNLAQALTKLNDNIFFDTNGNPITVQVAEYLRYNELFMGDPNYIHSIVRFKLPKNTVLKCNRGSGYFSGASYERFYDFGESISKIAASNEFQSLYACQFGNITLEGDFNFIQAYTKNLIFKNITVAGNGNFNNLTEGMSSEDVIIRPNCTENFNNSKKLISNKIEIYDNAANNYMDADGVNANSILLSKSTDNFRNTKNVKVVNNTLITNSNIISFAECDTIDLGNLTINQTSRNNIIASKNVKFRNLIIDASDNLLENENIDFGGSIGTTNASDGIVNSANIIRNTGVARFKAEMFTINAGANEGDVVDIINPSNNSFSQVLFNL